MGHPPHAGPHWSLRSCWEIVPARIRILGPRSWLSLIDGFALLQQRLQPPQHPRPAAIGLSEFWMGFEATVANPHESSPVEWFEFPSHFGLRVASPGSNPG